MLALWSPGDTFVTGWTTALGYDGTYTGSVQYIRDQGHDPGGNSVELGYYFGTNAIEQTFTTVPDQWYLVSFWLATNAYNGPSAQLRVLAGGMWEDFQAPAGSGDSSEMGWEPHSFAFPSESDGTTTLWFGNLAGIAAIDAITIVAVPETRTFCLLGIGTLTFILLRRK